MLMKKGKDRYHCPQRGSSRRVASRREENWLEAELQFMIANITAYSPSDKTRRPFSNRPLRHWYRLTM